MKRMMVATVVALALVVSLASVALAAGPGPAANVNGGPLAGQRAGAGYGTFVDLDGDGQCDEYATRTPAQDGTGSQWGRGDSFRRGPAGVPVQNGAGSPVRQGGRWGR